MKFLNHIPDDPYVTDDIFNAAWFVLARNWSAASPEVQGPSGATFALKVQMPVLIANTAAKPYPAPDTAYLTPDIAVATSDLTPDVLDKLAAAVANLHEMVKGIAQTQAESGEPALEAQPATSRPCHERCKFCGREGHTFHECAIIRDYIRQGRCRYSPLGNVVLSTGGAVLGGTPGV